MLSVVSLGAGLGVARPHKFLMCGAGHDQFTDGGGTV